MISATVTAIGGTLSGFASLGASTMVCSLRTGLTLFSGRAGPPSIPMRTAPRTAAPKVADAHLPSAIQVHLQHARDLHEPACQHSPGLGRTHPRQVQRRRDGVRTMASSDRAGPPA